MSETDPVVETQDFVITRADAEQVIVESGLFKPRTEYIVIGDEPRDKSGGFAPGVFDLKTSLSAEDYTSIKQYLTMMPRSMLWNFFKEKVWPGLPWETVVINSPPAPPIFYTFEGSGPVPSNRPRVEDPIYGGTHFKKQYEDMVWAGFIDLFNEANLEYINKNQMDAWTWEAEKTDAYYVSSSKEAIDELAKDIQGYQDVALALDPTAKKIMEEYILLPKLGDLGMEINRQNAIKELLKMKDYVTAQAIVDAYRYAKDTVLGDALTKPIPYDIVAADGSAVVRATNS